ncbi:MAG TPA: TIR domain-containing protein, partial [Pyrinomonadaceae bacterium]
ADVGNLVNFEKGEVFITEGDDHNDVYFILTGEADLSIKGTHVAIRRRLDAVGEMSIADPSEPRSATLTAVEDLVALKIGEPDFAKLAGEHPQIWKTIAVVGFDRLRKRAEMINVPNQNPLLFIGCSAESVKTAEEIQLNLNHEDINVRIWTNGVFGPSGITIEDLLKVVKEADFAAFLFTPDDVVLSRDEESNAPRDNVIFELGLFMGRLGRERTFIVKNHDLEIKIPSDLLGFTPITYKHKAGGKFEQEIAVACTQLKKAIKKLGTF